MTTHLDNARVEEALANLLERGVIRPSFSSDGQLIYGLIDRVG